MADTESQIKTDISAYIARVGGSYRTWYIGITNDIERRLFREHGVSRQNDCWAYATASSHLVARRIEQYFLRLGMSGGSGGGDSVSVIVYAYKKNWHTNP